MDAFAKAVVEGSQGRSGMDLKKRIEHYEALEQYRGKPLIVYATSTRTGVGAQMAGDAVREFIDQIEEIDPGKKDIDILIHSTGGDPLAAWKLMSLIRERFETVSVLVPYMAFSAATLFALGANEIVMHPNASLGPIDPQITVKLPDGKTRSFAYEDVASFLRFLYEEVKITDQPHTASVVDRLFSAVDPLVVGAARRASELSSSVGERLLSMHMTGVDGQQMAKKIATDLNKSFFAHADAVSLTRARELKLQIADDDPKLHELIWKAYLAVEEHMEFRKPFSPLHAYLSDPEAKASLQPLAPLGLPPNAPPAVVQQSWQAAANGALSNFGKPAKEVQFSLVNALVESVRTASEFRADGAISATRDHLGNIKLTVTEQGASWRKVTPAP